MALRKIVGGLSEYGAIELEELREKFGRKKVLKLAENECIRPPPAALLNYVRKRIDGMRRYPTCSYSKVKRVVAGVAGAGILPENICVGNGSLEVLDIAMRAFLEPGDRVVLPVPTYYNAMRQAAVNFADCEFVNTWPSLEFDAEKVLGVSDGAKIIYIASPNNPTGKLVKLAEIEKVAKGAPDAAVFVDEAYYDYCGITALPLLRRYPNIVVFRTFSKAYGLAGFRIGYAVAGAENVQAFDKIRLPFNVDIAAMAAVEWAAKNKKWKDGIVKETKKEREWLAAELKKIPGMKPVESSANFVLVFVKNSAAIKAELEEEGILISSFNDFPGLPEENLRISVGRREENQRVVDAIRKAMGA